MPRTLTILLALLLAGCSTAAPGPAALNTSAGSASSNATPLPGPLPTPASIACLGLRFVPVATTDRLAQSAISGEQAVSAAWQYESGLKSFPILDLALGQLGNPPDGSMTLSALAGNPLVWLVSFSGVQSVSSGPPGAVHHTSNTYAVVIDANSGQALFALPLCNLTTPPTQSP